MTGSAGLNLRSHVYGSFCTVCVRGALSGGK